MDLFGTGNAVVPPAMAVMNPQEFRIRCWASYNSAPLSTYFIREALRWQPDNGRQFVESHTTRRNATEIGNLDNLIKHFGLYNV
jgi:hypothetical protein